MFATPAAIPVTAPAALTVAVAALLQVQVPPAAVEVSVIEEPTHTVFGPDIAAAALTVRVW